MFFQSSNHKFKKPHNIFTKLFNKILVILTKYQVQKQSKIS